MTMIPTPIVDQDEGKREIVDVDRKSKRRLKKDGTEREKPRAQCGRCDKPLGHVAPFCTRHAGPK